MGGELKDPLTKQKVCGLTWKFKFNNKIGVVLTVTVCILGLLKSRPPPLFFKGGGA